jgi:hypothetical protein
VNPLKSVGARLGLALAVVVAGALVLVDLIAVPSLERNLIHTKLNQLREAAPAIAVRLGNSTDFELHDRIVAAQEAADARVVYFTLLDPNPLKLTVFEDSSPVTSTDVEEDPLVNRAYNAFPHFVSGTVASGGRRYAEVAYPLANGSVVLLRASLRDTLQSIHQVRRRLVIAGLIALGASLLDESGGSNGPPTASPAETSASRSSTQAATRSASSRTRSSGCASGCRSSSTRGGSSSPTLPTSCGRRCSRWAAFSS